MSTEIKEKKKNGRLAWVIPLSVVVIAIVYLVIGFGGIAKGFQTMDFAGMFEDVITAIVFLMIADVVVTVLCFIPIFRSKWNLFCAIWNIVLLGFTIYGLVA